MAQPKKISQRSLSSTTIKISSIHNINNKVIPRITPAKAHDQKVVSYWPYYCKCSPMSRTCPFKENKGRTRNNRQAYVHWKTNLFFCERKIPQEFWKGFTYFACIHRFFVLHMQTWAMAKGRKEVKRKLGFSIQTTYIRFLQNFPFI